MITFIYGKDDYRLRVRRREKLAELKKEHENVEVAGFDLEESGAEQILRFLENKSLFTPIRAVGVSSALDKEFLKDIKRFQESKNTHLVLTAEKKPPKTYKFPLKKPIESEEVKELSGAGWKKFITEEAKKRGVVLAGDAVSYLAEVYEKNSWGLVTELEKLVGFGEERVTKQHLAEAGLEQGPKFWGLMQSIKKPPETGVASLSRLLSGGEDAAKLFYVLASQWPQAAGWFARLDIAIKSGKADYEEALFALALVAPAE